MEQAGHFVFFTFLWRSSQHDATHNERGSIRHGIEGTVLASQAATVVANKPMLGTKSGWRHPKILTPTPSQRWANKTKLNAPVARFLSTSRTSCGTVVIQPQPAAAAASSQPASSFDLFLFIQRSEANTPRQTLQPALTVSSLSHSLAPALIPPPPPGTLFVSSRLDSHHG